MNLITWSEDIKKRRKEVNIYADPTFKFMIQFEEFVKLMVERFGGITVKKIEYKNREPDPLTMDGKRCMMDAMIMINDNLLLDIEMQAYKKETDHSRFSHYSDLLNILRIKRGNEYTAKASMVLLLSKYQIRRDQKESRNPIVKRFEDGMVFDDQDIIVPIELVQLKHLWKKPIKQLTAKERLLLWLEFGNDEQYEKEMDEIYRLDKELREMETRVRKSCMDDAMYFQLKDEADEYFKELEREINERKWIEEHQKRKEEQQLRMKEHQKRKEEQQLRKEERRKAVIMMVKKGYSEEEICEIFSMNKNEYNFIVKK